MSPSRVTRWREEGRLVIVTLPRHLVVLNESDEARLEPPWARTDIIVEARHRGLPPRTATPDDVSAALLRPGEADLFVQRHWWGPSRTHSLEVCSGVTTLGSSISDRGTRP